MRKSFWPLTSLLFAAAALAQPVPPLRIEIEFELTRNGSTMAEVVERLEHGNGGYQLTETWKGRGVYSLLGRAKRTRARELLLGSSEFSLRIESVPRLVAGLFWSIQLSASAR